MVENIKILIQDIFISFFQVIWFSSIIAALSLYIHEKNPSKSLKKLIVEFLQMFKNNKKLKNKYFIFLYFAFVAFMTLFNRKPYLNPLNNIFGGWNLFSTNGQFNADAVENIVLFIPMGSILTFYASSMSIKKWSYILSRCIMISLGIETIQLFLFLGTFQFADVFYNTLGGIIGKIIYLCFGAVKNMRRMKVNNPE